MLPTRVVSLTLAVDIGDPHPSAPRGQGLEAEQATDRVHASPGRLAESEAWAVAGAGDGRLARVAPLLVRPQLGWIAATRVAIRQASEGNALQHLCPFWDSRRSSLLQPFPKRFVISSIGGFSPERRRLKASGVCLRMSRALAQNERSARGRSILGVTGRTVPPSGCRG
jgi:hypothetical protein